MTGPDPAQYGWWLASRASGVVALALITASVAIGLTMAGKVMRRPGIGRKLKALHEHTALAGLVAIVIHGITLLGDRWLRPGVTGILVPFQMGYRPVFTGLGILAGYLAAALGLSFYARRRLGARLWRMAHRATVVVYLLALVHVLGAGTDAGSTWLRAFILATGIPVALLFLRRLLPRRRRPVVAPEARP
jgi:methionine sulfoxide reductase heme-binding subunit